MKKKKHTHVHSLKHVSWCKLDELKISGIQNYGFVLRYCNKFTPFLAIISLATFAKVLLSSGAYLYHNQALNQMQRQQQNLYSLESGNCFCFSKTRLSMMPATNFIRVDNEGLFLILSTLGESFELELPLPDEIVELVDAEPRFSIEL
ncbi:Fructose-1,6-bisphosphatase class 1 [Frankliniella fusca]|uniref:Fructose-1,6-bisphosphatase class 1 n=1 Tax=Frankliniella fusca TaxID=407009 RepID=A0AAE1H1R4_9NEOP|nr:Fructose-1,6-bisphosphatase class 1 [Frankliniella fusca]